MPSTCPACDGILDLVFEDKAENRGLAGEVESPGIWIWQDWLPACAPENRVTLGEGRTPLLRCPRLGEGLGLSSLWVKCDSIMPSGSFKDRALALTASLARNYGKAGIVLSSSGNAGASAAAYAARAGPRRLGARAGERAAKQACANHGGRRAARPRQWKHQRRCCHANDSAHPFGG